MSKTPGMTLLLSPKNEQMNHRFYHDYAEFDVIAANLDWNPSALRNAVWMWLPREIKDSFTYCDMPEEHPAFVMVCQRKDNLS